MELSSYGGPIKFPAMGLGLRLRGRGRGLDRVSGREKRVPARHGAHRFVRSRVTIAISPLNSPDPIVPII